MRLTHLTVTDLGPLASVDLDLAPVNVLMGRNEVGKSFVIDSLAVLRTGTARGLKVNESHAFVRNGAKGWAVEATALHPETGAPVTLRRTRSQAPPAGELEAILGDVRVFQACTQVGSFLRMTCAERRELVAGLVAGDTSGLAEHLETKAPAEVVAAVREGNLKRAHRLATERRRALDRALEDQRVLALQATEDPDVLTKSGPRKVSSLSKEAIETAVTNARARLAEAHKEAEVVAAHRETIKAADAARTELDSMGGGQAWSDEDERAYADVTRRAEENRLAAARLVGRQTAALEQANTTEGLLKQGGTCPTCGQDMAPAKARALALHQEAVGAYQKITQELTALATEHAALAEARKEYAERKQNWERESVYRRRLEAVIARAEPLLNLCMVDPPTAHLEAEVRRVEEIHRTRLEYDARQAIAQKAVASREALTAERDAALYVEEATTPDKIEAEEEVLGRLNDVLREYGPLLFPGPWVQVAPTWEVYYAGYRVELASDSAAIRIGTLLAVALASLSRLGLLCVDRLESLDDPNRMALLTLVGKAVADGRVKTAFLAVVKEEPRGTSNLPWLQYVKIADGSASVMEG